MIAEIEIRKRIVQFLTNEITLDDFEDWLVTKSWNMHAGSTDRAQKLAGEVELRLSEYSRGDITLEALRESLIPFATDVTVVIAERNSPVVSICSSSTTTTSNQWADAVGVPAWQPFGT